MKKFIMFVAIIVALFVAFFYIDRHIPIKKLYFISPLNMYLETIYYPKDDYGYIVFSKGRYLELCDTIDYISVSKETGDRCAIIFIDSTKQNELNFFISSGFVYKQNPVKYKFNIHKTEGSDVYNFYKKENRQSQKQYFNIEISDFFESIFISNYKDSCLYKLSPIN